METILVILGIYFALPLLLAFLSWLFGLVVDFAAWLLDGMPARKPAAAPRTQTPSGKPYPSFQPIPLSRVGGC